MANEPETMFSMSIPSLYIGILLDYPGQTNLDSGSGAEIVRSQAQSMTKIGMSADGCVGLDGYFS